MYCISCGVRLEDTEKKCPLCNTLVYHPNIERQPVPSLYPENQFPAQKMSAWGIMVIITTAFILGGVISLLCDLKFSGEITWSGYVIGALILAYVILILPFWFKKPNPVVFVPSDFGGVALFLLYIALKTGGNWYLTFALPTTVVLGIIVTAAVTLLKYLKRGKLYIVGGMLILLGGFSLLVEFLLTITFGLPFIAWSVYPFVTLVLVGCMLIFLAIYPPARETMERKFFI